jgi:hypothetical protein
MDNSSLTPPAPLGGALGNTLFKLPQDVVDSLSCRIEAHAQPLVVNAPVDRGPLETEGN